MKNFSLFPLSTNPNTRTGSFLSTLQKEINSLFDSSLSQYIEFNPPLDMNETNEGYELHIELAGIPKKNIKVEISNHLITISGKKETRTSKKNHKAKHRECSYGEFMRSITLPQDADEDSVTARIEHGLLTIHLKKKEEAVTSPQRMISIEGN